MKAVKPKLHNGDLAKDQPEYITLPIYRKTGLEREVVTKWELSDEEIEKLKETKTLYFAQLTFGHPFQPVILTVNESDVYTEKELKEANEGTD